ncbi:MAG: hypothetical protein AAF337_01765 [Pseudomonadota bacterium]
MRSKTLPLFMLLAGAAIGAQLATATAHPNTLTRLDIQNAMTSALQRQAQMQKGLSPAELETTLTRVLARCRFQGQLLEGRSEENDALDFQGTVRC